MQNRWTCCLKSVLIRKDQNFCAPQSKDAIVNQNALNSEGFLGVKGRPSNYLFQLFLAL